MFAINHILNLHNLYFEGESFVEKDVENVLDDFVSPFLSDTKDTTLLIITGKGIHSDHFIEGKNPLRYYTESYLQKIGLSWRYEDQKHGGE